MLLCELLNAQTVRIIDNFSGDKISLLKEMAEEIGKVYRLDKEIVDKIKKELISREMAASTCMGKGVAIPHAEIDGLVDIVAMLWVLKQPFEYGCPLVEDQTVRIIIMLLFPKGKFREHIMTLAGISHLMRNEELRKKILTFNEAEKVFFYILKEEADKFIKVNLKKEIPSSGGKKDG